jgi:hypothetical protein
MCINLFANNLLLLAERNVFRDLGSGFRAKRETFQPSDLIPWIIVTAIVIGGLAILARVVARREKQAFDSPRALFRELSKAHGLDFTSRRLLRRLARVAGLKQPARLFLEPQCFEPTDLPKDLQEVWPSIESLRARLFGQSPVGTSSSETAAATNS